jgi:hypothetical protein
MYGVAFGHPSISEGEHCIASSASAAFHAGDGRLEWHRTRRQTTCRGGTRFKICLIMRRLNDVQAAGAWVGCAGKGDFDGRYDSLIFYHFRPLYFVSTHFSFTLWVLGRILLCISRTIYFGFLQLSYDYGEDVFAVRLTGSRGSYESSHQAFISSCRVLSG